MEEKKCIEKKTSWNIEKKNDSNAIGKQQKKTTQTNSYKQLKNEVIKRIDVTRNSGRICYLVSIC